MVPCRLVQSLWVHSLSFLFFSHPSSHPPDGFTTHRSVNSYSHPPIPLVFSSASSSLPCWSLGFGLFLWIGWCKNQNLTYHCWFYILHCLKLHSLVQFSSVTQSCPTLCDPINHSMPGLPVHHQLPGFTQTQIHRVSDGIQPSHPLSSPFPPAPNPSQHQGLFQWVSSSHQVAKVLEFQLQHQSFQWTPRTDLP